MLQRIRIENLGIITELEVEFSKGLTVLTGETGVGKSMLLSAIDLLGGAKANESLIRSGASRLTLVGTFDFSKHPDLLQKLVEEECESGSNEVEVRRLISTDGRNRVFINDIPAKLQLLRKLAATWFDIHGQRDSHSLIDTTEQLSYIDAYAKNGKLLQEYQLLHTAYKTISAELERLVKEEKTMLQQRSLLQFQAEELEAAQLRENEESELDEELNTLTHIEQIKAACYEGMMSLDEGEGSVNERIHDVDRSLSSVSRFERRLEPLCERLLSVREEVKDIASELNTLFEKSEYSKERLDEVNERIAFLNDLSRKYGREVSELIPLHQEIREKLEEFASNSEKQEELKRKKKALFEQLSEKGCTLALKREEGEKQFSKQLVAELAPLNMEKVRFEVSFLYPEVEPDEEGVVFPEKSERPLGFSDKGIGSLRFDIAPNPGEPLKPLGEIVSGGELSRIMLSIKSMLSENDDLPTLIFDEIDTGIGGDTAHRVGEKLRKISRSRQVMTISHLPQIALQGDTHFKIEKSYHQERTETSITPLNEEERIEELLRMFGNTGSAEGEVSRQFVLRLLEGLKQGRDK